MEPPAIVTMVRAGLGLGLIRFVISAGASEVQDEALAEELGRALQSHAPSPGTMTVRVVRNFAHPDFERDPIVPFLVARVAHRLVAGFLAEHSDTYTLGIAGGIHLASFVRTIDSDGSPFPEGGEGRFTLVPLTLEPFHDHHLELADALVGELHSRAAMLLGPPRVQAWSLNPSAYFEDRKTGEIETQSILMVRELYLNLDVAIYGCGDRSDDGWIEWTRKMGIEGFSPPPPTDVCLTPISETGEPIPFPKDHGHQGVRIDHVRSLAAKRDKLALLLTSGASKGKPITLVARAGCVNAVVCDQAAALEALRVLARK